MKLVFVDALGVVEKAADEGGLSVVDRACGREAKQVAAVFLGEKAGEREVRGLKFECG
jgi:hypothetical protein